MKNRGFTLIELLVVIAIISLLSSVVVNYLNQSRKKTADTVVKESMHSIRNQAEIFYTNNEIPTYGSNANCVLGNETGVWADAGVKDTISSIKLNIDPSGIISCSTDSAGERWAISVSKLKNTGKSWCIDSSGFVGETTVSQGSGVCGILVSQGNNLWSFTQLSSGTWVQSSSLCSSLADGALSGWRMPTLSELSAAYRDQASGFGSNYYWTSQSSGGGHYRTVHMGNGNTNAYVNGNSNIPSVRCIK
ncbi:prepilin-type N-terminal cleavage/methylation domain-containing protein [Candidatus Nomurabacteria bacterium]|nr:prepilin-type N-terminal cleavage/methylation domain-containing protein [Candidatus Nomurabacteria bacterium]